MATKAEKFRSLATKRVDKALKLIRQVSNLSNRATYEYTQDQVDKMFDALGHAIEDAKAKFTNKAQPKESGFQL